MRIVQHGKTIPEEKRFNCNTCGCIFYAEKGEYKRESDFRNDSYFHAICPECGGHCYRLI